MSISLMREKLQKSLAQSTFQELLQLAKRLNLPIKETLTRNKLLVLIQQHFQKKIKKKSPVLPSPSPKTSDSPEKLSPLQERLKQKNKEQLRSPFEIFLPEPSPSSIFIDLGLPVPEVYYDNFLELMPVAPDRIYAYWELSSETFLNLQDQYGRLNPLVLKLTNVQTEQFEVYEVPQQVTEFYFQVKPRQTYQLSLYLLTAKNQLHFLLESRPVTTSAIAPAEASAEKWLMVEDGPKGSWIEEPGVLIETGTQTAVFVPVRPAHREAFPKAEAMPTPTAIIIQKSAELPQKNEAFVPYLESPVFPTEPTPSEPLQSNAVLPSENPNLSKSVEVFQHLKQDLQKTFPVRSEEVLLFHQPESSQQYWVQEKTGERWFWVPVQQEQFSQWVQENPVRWAEGGEGAWIHFAEGSGPQILPGPVQWYYGKRDGESWVFQEGETHIRTQWLPVEGAWEEVTPSIQWVQGQHEEGMLVIFENAPQEVVWHILEEPYLTIGSSEMTISSRSWITSRGGPGWARPVSSWRFPVSSGLRRPTSGEVPFNFSSFPQWRKVQIPSSSWAYPVSRPEISSWIFPYKVPKIPQVQEWLPVSSHLFSVSSWGPQVWPTSSWSQPYLRWVYPEEFWTRPLLNWPSGIGIGSSEMSMKFETPLALPVTLPENTEIVHGSAQKISESLRYSPWKPLPADQTWTLPRISLPNKP